MSKHEDMFDSFVYAHNYLKNKNKNKKEITWIDAIKALIDGKVVKVIHKGYLGDSEYTFRKTSDGEFRYFDANTYTFQEGYLDADDITEGKWYLVE